MFPEGTPAEWLFHQEKGALKKVARTRLLWFRSSAFVGLSPQTQRSRSEERPRRQTFCVSDATGSVLAAIDLQCNAYRAEPVTVKLAAAATAVLSGFVKVAMIVAAPLPTPVTSPDLLTVATDSSVEVHMTPSVISS